MSVIVVQENNPSVSPGPDMVHLAVSPGHGSLSVLVLLLKANLGVTFQLMCFEITDPGEAATTQGAAVRFFARVDPLVFPQVSGLGEHLPTGGAAERLLPGVDPLVDLHLLGPIESFATVAAHKEALTAASGRLFGWRAAVAEGLGRRERSVVTIPTVNAGGGRQEINGGHGIGTRWTARVSAQGSVKELCGGGVGVVGKAA